MNNHPYWKIQDPAKALFPDIEWSKPEQRQHAGKLGIIGGNKLGFISVAEAYTTSLNTGAGSVKVLLPDALKKTIPKTITDTLFATTNQSGGLSKEAITEMKALGSWAESILLIGDAGRNSETAIVYEEFIQSYTSGQLVITRDAVDLLKNSMSTILDRPNTLLVVSFAQLQKIFQAVYYPKVLTFSMNLINLIETLHKFTISYPVTIVVPHRENIIIASDGEVVTTKWDNQMAIWRGSVATKAACFWLWTPNKPVEAIATSLI